MNGVHGACGGVFALRGVRRGAGHRTYSDFSTILDGCRCKKSRGGACF